MLFKGGIMLRLDWSCIKKLQEWFPWVPAGWNPLQFNAALFIQRLTFKIVSRCFTEIRPDPPNKQHSKENTLLTGRNLELIQVHILGVGGTLLTCSKALKHVIY